MKRSDDSFSCFLSRQFVSSQIKLAEASKAISSRRSRTQRHLHPDRMHITYTEKGKGFCCIEDKNYDIYPGVINFVYPNEVHQYYSNQHDPYRTYFLHFDTIGQIPQERPRSILVGKQDRKRINQLFHKLFYLHYYYAGASRKERTFSAIFELFAEMADMMGSPVAKNEKALMDEEFFMEILKPLYTPPFSNPGIDKMARWNNMSRRTFTRTFKRNTGMSITEYLTRAKLIHANYLLENSSMSIKEVASECGYSNSQNLRRALKKFASEEL